MLDLSTGTYRLLDSGHAQTPEPTWSHSDRAVYFLGSKDRVMRQVFRADVASGAIERVSFSNQVEQSLTSDASGRRLAFARFNGVFQLYVMNSETGASEVVARHLGTQILPAFAPTTTVESGGLDKPPHWGTESLAVTRRWPEPPKWEMKQ